MPNDIDNGILLCENGRSWNQFLANCPGANFYQRFEWKAVNEQEFGHQTFFLASIQAGAVEGVFPLVLIKSRIFGRILCSMPFVNFGGPVALTSRVEASLIERACELAAAHRAKYLEIRGTRELEGGLQTTAHKLSLTLKLDNDPKVIWEGFKHKHRKNIKRVYKDHIYVKHGGAELLEPFYEIMANSWRSLGTPLYRKQYFAKILEAFGTDIKIFVAYHDQAPIAAAMTGYFNRTVEGIWAGIHPNGRDLQPNYVLYWEMIEDACERGFASFHLGRSTAGSGSESFKRRWGADATQLYWHYFMPQGGGAPQLNVDNPKFKLAINAWKRLPLGITKAAGPLIAGSIP